MQVIENDGTKRSIEPYHQKRLKAILNEPNVKEVRVFKLKPGMVVNIEGTIFKVIAARPNGKVVLKLKEKV